MTVEVQLLIVVVVVLIVVVEKSEARFSVGRGCVPLFRRFVPVFFFLDIKNKKICCTNSCSRPLGNMTPDSAVILPTIFLPFVKS